MGTSSSSPDVGSLNENEFKQMRFMENLPTEVSVSASAPAPAPTSAAAVVPTTRFLPLVYSPRYNLSFLGLERLHPFDSSKYSKVVAGLSERNQFEYGDEKGRFIPGGPRIKLHELCLPIEASTKLLRVVHTASYLNSLEKSLNVAKILEVPPLAVLPNFLVQKYALGGMRCATAGTLLAAELAMRKPSQPVAAAAAAAASSSSWSSSSSSSSSSAAPIVAHVPPLDGTVADGWAINIGGGFHHCSHDESGGFCPYGDLSLAVLLLGRKYGLKRLMIVDCDAHQGNGYANDKLDGVFNGTASDGSDKIEVFILDMFNERIYPQDRRAMTAIDCPVRLKPGTGDEEYMKLLQMNLNTSINKFQPQVLIYNAGTDCLRGDPLGCLDITPEGICQRDHFIFHTCKLNKIPIVMCMSGGYQKSNAGIIATSISRLQSELNLWKLDPILEKENIQMEEERKKTAAAAAAEAAAASEGSSKK